MITWPHVCGQSFIVACILADTGLYFLVGGKGKEKDTGSSKI